MRPPATRCAAQGLRATPPGDCKGPCQGANIRSERGDNFGRELTTLRLRDKDYHDGIFCWQGFPFYQWVIPELTPKLAERHLEVALRLARPCGEDPAWLLGVKTVMRALEA